MALTPTHVAPKGYPIEYTEIPLNLILASENNDVDILSMHIDGLPTGVNASLNYGTLNSDGSYTLTPTDLTHLSDLKLITDGSIGFIETGGMLHLDVISSEGASILHSYIDIPFGIIEYTP